MNKIQSLILEHYKEHFFGSPVLINSPGRINLIGEHTDYNMGFVLPASIDKAIYLALNKNSKNKIRLYSIDMEPAFYQCSLNGEFKKTGIDWADYIIGVVDELNKAGYEIGGFDCVFGGDVPIGAGLSSSAALEGGLIFGLNEIFSLKLSRVEMAKLSQRAENNFVGVQCGIMDQFASLLGKQNNVMKIDCRSLEFKYFPFVWDDIKIVLCDTKVRRKLAGSEYNVRREQCEEGVRIIKKGYPEVKSLRDISSEILEEFKSEMDEVVYNRCSFILEENERVDYACGALMDKDLPELGGLMYKSHEGLRNKYEVSCDELDVLVDATVKFDNVLGSRMMGGGFGGCTINLVKEDFVEEFKEQISSLYKAKTGFETDVYITQINQGTQQVN